MNGTLTFEFEDAAGKKHTVTEDFTFNIGEMQAWDDPGMWDEPIMPEKKGLPTWAWIAIAAGVLVVGGTVIGISKKRKKAKQEALDLDE
jgi:hypothetical protein